MSEVIKFAENVFRVEFQDLVAKYPEIKSYCFFFEDVDKSNFLTHGTDRGTHAYYAAVLLKKSVE